MAEVSSLGKLHAKAKAASEGEQGQCLLQIPVLCSWQKGSQGAMWCCFVHALHGVVAA